MGLEEFSRSLPPVFNKIGREIRGVRELEKFGCFRNGLRNHLVLSRVFAKEKPRATERGETCPRGTRSYLIRDRAKAWTCYATRFCCPVAKANQRKTIVTIHFLNYYY